MTKQEILSKYAQDRTRCTVYTRVMGYHRPVETFNAGKQGEFHDRVHFVEPGAPAPAPPKRNSRDNSPNNICEVDGNGSGHSRHHAAHLAGLSK